VRQRAEGSVYDDSSNKATRRNGGKLVFERAKRRRARVLARRGERGERREEKGERRGGRREREERGGRGERREGGREEQVKEKRE